jgi:hypothetical protein
MAVFTVITVREKTRRVRGADGAGHRDRAAGRRILVLVYSAYAGCALA